MKWSNWGWLATVTLAFWFGRQTKNEARTAIAVVESEAPACSIASAPERSVPRIASRWQPRASASRVAESEARSASRKFELGDPRGLDELTQRMLAYADAKLAEGPEGQLELLETLDREITKKHVEIERLMDPSDASRQIYPWLRFAMDREDRVIEMTETVFATMASDPQRFAEINHGTLELFTEGLAITLPGAVSEEQLGRFREYAQAILDAPPEDLPPSVNQQRGKIEQALDMWQVPIDPSEVLDRLEQGPESASEMRRLMRRIDPETASRLDPLALFGTQLERGDLSAISYLYPFQLTPDRHAGIIAALDDRLLSGTGGNIESHQVQSYLQSTGRSTPEAQADFFQRARQSARAGQIIWNPINYEEIID